MQHLLLGLYFLLFATGSAGISSLAFLRMKLKSRIVGTLLGIQVLLMLGLALILAYFYLKNILSDGVSAVPFLTGAVSVLSMITQTMLYLLAYRLIAALKTGGRFRPLLRTLAAGSCLLVAGTSIAFMAIQAFPVFAPLALAARGPVASAGTFALVGVAVALVGLSLFTAPLAGEHSATRLLVRGWAWSLFAFVPLTVLEWIGESFAAGSGRGPFSFDFVFYVSVSGVAVAAFVRSLRVERNRGEALRKLTVSDDAAALFGLTSRERDVVPLIARGLSNKEIAAELGVSVATARTHVYNLFQKTGAANRIELLNRLDL